MIADVVVAFCILTVRYQVGPGGALRWYIILLRSNEQKSKITVSIRRTVSSLTSSHWVTICQQISFLRLYITVFRFVR